MIVLAILVVAVVALYVGWILYDCDQDAEYWYQQSRKHCDDDDS